MTQPFEDDPLDDFGAREVTLEGVTKVVRVAGTGPGVIVMPEMPGISPHVARFGRWVRDAGFTVYLPSLFGRDGAVPDVEEGSKVFQQAFKDLVRSPHSVVTAHLIDEAGQPTTAARDEILAFFTQRLLSARGSDPHGCRP